MSFLSLNYLNETKTTALFLLPTKRLETFFRQKPKQVVEIILKMYSNSTQIILRDPCFCFTLIFNEFIPKFYESTPEFYPNSSFPISSLTLMYEGEGS